jgi:UDP-N-acetylglucosamine--N-acetylmuramyl-(pentapeptide) pyrophosphoryl-undecaprenol N-acetylglucosamine transferase
LVIEEEKLNSESLIKCIDELSKNRETYIKAMRESPVKNGVDNIIEVIQKYCKV